MWNLKRVYPYQGKGVKLQLRLTLVMRTEGLYFSSSTASLVANNSICDHGSHLSIANVFKCLRALRHPHLRRQFKQDRNGTEMCQWVIIDVASPGTLPTMNKFLPQGREASASLAVLCCLKMHLSPIRFSMAISVC